MEKGGKNAFETVAQAVPTEDSRQLGEASEVGGFASIGVLGLIILLVIVLVLFVPHKLPEVGSAVGKTLAEFRKSTRDIMDAEESQAQKVPKKKELS